LKFKLAQAPARETLQTATAYYPRS
jgi:hypothetical protein